MNKNNSTPQKILPSEGFVLLKILSNENNSSIEIASDGEVPQRGLVLSVGKDTYREGTNIVLKSPCNVDDVVVHSGYGWEKITFNGEEYRLCPFTKILAVIK